MEDKMPATNKAASDEIDIREVFNAIGRFFRRIGNSIIIGILRWRQATRKFAWLIIACMLTGAGIGFLGYQSFEPYYASDLIVSSRYYSSEMLESAINELNQLAGEGNDAILAKKLNVTPEQASTIRSFRVVPVTTTKERIEVENLLQSIKSNGEITEDQVEELRTRLLAEFTSFKIVATVYNPSILNYLEEGVVAYLKDNEYISRRVSVEQENLITLRDKLIREQDRLERLKNLQAEAYGRLVESSRSGSNNVILGTAEKDNDPMIVFQEDLLFSKELKRTNERLQLNSGLEVVSGFTPYGSPASLSLRQQLIVGALIGMGAAYLILLLIGINQALNRYEAKHLSETENTFA